MILMSSKQEQQLIAQAQMFQQQIQEIVSQKEALNIQSIEIKRALDEIEKSKSDLYKIAGPILVKSDKESIKNDLTEKSDFIDLKKKTLERSESKIKERFEELRSKLSKIS